MKYTNWLRNDFLKFKRRLSAYLRDSSFVRMTPIYQSTKLPAYQTQCLPISVSTNLKASSLVEVIVAMTVIILVMTITFSLITQVYKNSTNEIELRKQIHIQTSLSETYNNQAFIPRKYEYSELEIQQDIKNDSSKKTNQVLSISIDTTFVIKTLVASGW